MSLLTLIQEIWRFVRNHIKQFILGAILGMVVVLSTRYALGRILLNQQNDSYEYLQHIYSQEPAEFQAIISLNDGQIFANSNIYDEYLSSTSVVEHIEKQTGIKFGRWKTDERNLELREEGSYRGALSAIRDSSSDLITFRVLVGQNKEENLKIAQAYVDFLESDDMAFKKIHNIQITHQPEIIEFLNLDKVQNVPNDKTLNLYAGMTPKNIVVFSVLGLILGTMLSFVWAFYKMLKQKTIDYAFEYSWDLDDDHTLLNRQDINQENFQHLLEFPYLVQRYIVTENGQQDLSSLQWKHMTSDNIVHDVKEIARKDGKPEEIILLVDGNKTHKNWYRNQYHLAKKMNVPIKIIHRLS